MNLNMFFNLRWIWSKKTSASSFYQENNFKPCLTKQLLNMFKLWCERGIGLDQVLRLVRYWPPFRWVKVNAFNYCTVKLKKIFKTRGAFHSTKIVKMLRNFVPSFLKILINLLKFRIANHGAKYSGYFEIKTKWNDN